MKSKDPSLQLIAVRDQIEVSVHFRDIGGIPAAYNAVEARGARATIELLLSGVNGIARGTETLYGNACSASESRAVATQKSMVALDGRTCLQDRKTRKCPRRGQRQYHVGHPELPDRAVLRGRHERRHAGPEQETGPGLGIGECVRSAFRSLSRPENRP